MILTVIVATFKANWEILRLAFLFEQFDEVDVFMDEFLFFWTGGAVCFVGLLLLHLDYKYLSISDNLTIFIRAGGKERAEVFDCGAGGGVNYFYFFGASWREWEVGIIMEI